MCVKPKNPLFIYYNSVITTATAVVTERIMEVLGAQLRTHSETALPRQKRKVTIQ